MRTFIIAARYLIVQKHDKSSILPYPGIWEMTGLDEDDSSSSLSDEDQPEDDLELGHCDPLKYLDASRLAEVLDAKTIGDAIQLLCPHLPTLPTRTRGTYLKRKRMTAEQKETLQRNRNRENARRARKRKKTYALFLDAAIRAISTTGAQGSGQGVHVDAAPLQRSAEIHANVSLSHEGSHVGKIAVARTETELNARHRDRIVTLQRLFELRFGCCQSTAPTVPPCSHSASDLDLHPWSTVCCDRIIVVSPQPTFLGPLVRGDTDDNVATAPPEMLQLQGLRALQEASTRLRAFFSALKPIKTLSNGSTWTVETAIQISEPAPILSAGAERMVGAYEIAVDCRMSPLQSEGSERTSQEHLSRNRMQLLRVPVMFLASFDPQGLVSHLEEQYDVRSILETVRSLTPLSGMSDELQDV